MKNIKKTIFAVLVLFVGTSLFIRCSNDSQTDSEVEGVSLQARLNSTDLVTATNMYRDMMLTSEYLNYKDSQKQLLIKMNSNNVIFSDKKEWITWLENNLNKTSFTSVEEFSYMFDTSMSKLNHLISANSLLYDFMAGADIYDLGVILLPEHTTPPVQTTFGSCVDGCVDANLAASAASWNTFLEDTEDGMQAGGVLGAVAIWFAQQDYNTREEGILNDYMNCFSACQ